jgi:hypothetical protein
VRLSVFVGRNVGPPVYDIPGPSRVAKNRWLVAEIITLVENGLLRIMELAETKGEHHK